MKEIDNRFWVCSPRGIEENFAYNKQKLRFHPSVIFGEVSRSVESKGTMEIKKTLNGDWLGSFMEKCTVCSIVKDEGIITAKGKKIVKYNNVAEI